MKIIADTNIWYKIGNDKELFQKIRTEPISPTFVNIFELAKSDNIINNEDLSRVAIQKLFAFKHNAIFDPPFIYTARLNNELLSYSVDEIEPWLRFIEKFANGHSVEISKQDNFKKEIERIRTNYKLGAEFFNEEAENIRESIKDKRKHRKIETFELTAAFINFLVENVTHCQFNLDGFDLNGLELLIKTLDCFFKSIETGAMKMTDNDWHDLSILAYVQPGDKYWTYDRKWLNLIKSARCENYLFNI